MITDTVGNQYAICNAIDVTESHRLKATLERTKEILEQTNQAARIGAWEVDIGNNLIYWSAITKQIFEVPEEFQPDFENARNYFAPADMQYITDVFAKALAAGNPVDTEVEIITGKGN